MQFSNQKQVDPFNPPSGLVLQFLSQMFADGKSYSTINSAKSAISSMCGLLHNRDIGNEILVRRFMRGIFTSRPQLPKYSTIWDVNIVFKYIASLGDNDKLTLLTLSEKLVILLLLISGQRGQTVHLMNLNDVHVYSDKIVIYFSSLLKHSSPKRHLEPLIITHYPINNKLCVVRTTREYLDRTTPIRGDCDKFLISTVPPHKGVTKSTVSRWIKSIMTKAGIDTKVFQPHSCRAASTSNAIAKGLQLGTVLKAAGWSSATTFQQYYHRQIQGDTFNHGLQPEGVVEGDKD